MGIQFRSNYKQRLRTGLMILLILCVNFAADCDYVYQPLGSTQLSDPRIEMTVTGNEPITGTLLEHISTVATQVITAADAWSSNRLFDGTNNVLKIHVNSESGNAAESRYRLGSTCVEVNLSANSDIVAHETGHAIIHRLKPGWTKGAALIVHEALADMFAVLFALRSSEDVQRVLDATAGDLRVPNDASEILDNGDGTSLRTTRSNTTLETVGVRRDLLHMQYTPGSPHDPHAASQVLAAALYDVLLVISQNNSGALKSPVQAVLSAADDLGSTMLRALFLCSEHRVTLREYSIEFIRTYSQTHSGSLIRPIAEVFVNRGLLAVDDSIERRAMHPAATSFRIRVEPLNPNLFILNLASFEAAIRKNHDIARSEIQSLPSLLYDPDSFYIRRVDPASVHVREVFINPFAPERGCFIRLEYTYALPSPSPGEYANRETIFFDSEIERFTPAVAGFLFDSYGGLTGFSTDRPL
jgi:hypothetical protein